MILYTAWGELGVETEAAILSSAFVFSKTNFKCIFVIILSKRSTTVLKRLNVLVGTVLKRLNVLVGTTGMKE